MTYLPGESVWPKYHGQTVSGLVLTRSKRTLLGTRYFLSIKTTTGGIETTWRMWWRIWQ